MYFSQLIDHFKGVREQHQTLPFPAPYPAQLICFDGETIVCQVASATSTATAVAAMFSAIPVAKANRASFSMETIVRDLNWADDTKPIGVDPASRAAVLIVQQDSSGLTDEAIEAFSTDDGGQLEWVQGRWFSPLIPVLNEALHESLAASVPNSVADFVTWMQINGYGIQMHPSLYNQHE